MEWLQQIDPARLPLIAAGCGLLCIVLFVVSFLLSAVSGIVEVIGGILEVVVDIAQGGPLAWCGCLLLIGVGLASAGLLFLFLNAPASCAEHPTNFCQWFGFLP